MRQERLALRAIPRIIALALFVVPAAAHAAPTEGERLFREGRTAMQEKDYDTACPRFAESQRKEPAPGTALNLGDCEEKRSHLVAAREAFTTAASTFTTQDKKGYAAGRAEALEKRIPKLIVKVSGAPRGVVVHVGDRVVEPGVELHLDPGEVVLTAEAPGFRAKKLPVSLKEGQVSEIELGPLDKDAVTAKTKPDAPVPTPPPGEHGERSSNGTRTLAYALAGVGLASLVVGGVTGIMTLDRASTVKDHCDGDLACDGVGARAASSGKTLSLVSTITVIAGVVGIGAGGVLLLTAPPRRTAMTTIGPGPGDLGLMMRRSF